MILYGSVLNYKELRMYQTEDCEDVHLAETAGFSSHREPLRSGLLIRIKLGTYCDLVQVLDFYRCGAKRTLHSSTCCFLEHPLLIWSTVTSEFFRKLFADFGSMSVWHPHVFSSHYVHLFHCFTLTLHLHLMQIFSGHPLGIWEPCRVLELDL